MDSYGGGGGYSSGGGGGGYSSGGSYDGGYSDDDRNFPTGRASDLDPALIQAVDNMTTPPNKSAGVENATTTKPRCLGVVSVFHQSKTPVKFWFLRFISNLCFCYCNHHKFVRNTLKILCSPP